MGNDSDDIVSLPSPPPPRPAARQAAIDNALRKFDGIEERPAARPARERPGRIRWGTLHRRPAGALIAVAIIAVVSVPAIQIVLRNPPAEPASEAAPALTQNQTNAEETGPAVEAPPAQPDAAATGVAFPVAQSPAQPQEPTSDRSERAETQETIVDASPSSAMMAPAQRAEAAAPPPPPPPSPPPPPALASEKLAAEDDGIVVTGSRLARPTMDAASPVVIIGAESGFLSRLQTALAANDRRAVIALVGFPLRVNFGGERATYRSARDVERDFDRIFTPRVRSAVRNQQPANLARGDGGRLMGNSRLWFGCAQSSCQSESAIRIREVSP